MTSCSALDSFRSAKGAVHSTLPSAVPATAARKRSKSAHQTMLPAQPSAIPVNAAPRLPLQRKLAVGAVNDPLEAEADAMAAKVLSGAAAASSTASASAAALHRQASGGAVPSVEAPASVHQALHSPGQPLDAATRASLEPRFGRDMSRVRIHTGPQAAQSASDVQANAYTVGQDVFFAAGRYNPHSGEGKRLLAHELSHTVQQAAVAPVVQRDPTPQAAADDKKKKTKPDAVTLPLPSDFMNRFKLTPPSLLTPPQQPSIFSPGQYTLGPQSPGASGAGAAPAPNLYPPSLFPTPTTTPLGPTQPAPTPLPASPASPSAAPGAAPQAPSRVSIYSNGSGTFSVGTVSASRISPRMPPSLARRLPRSRNRSSREAYQLSPHRSDPLSVQRRSRQANRRSVGNLRYADSARRSGQDCLRPVQQARLGRPVLSVGCDDSLQHGQRLRPHCD